MRVRSVVPGVVSAMLFLFAIGCAKQEPPKPAPAPAAAVPAAPEADGKTLFETKCSVCHGLDRPAALKQTKEEWANLVKEMQGKRADWISDAEASKIVDYLAATYGRK